jgi:hypothetical protein
MDARELAWASGLFDGEGCITYGRDTRYPKFVYVRLHLAMTDEDSVIRFRDALGFGLLTLPRIRPGRKKLYQWRVNNFEQAQAAIALLWFGLNDRRRARARECLDAVRESQSLRVNLRRGLECELEDCRSPVLAGGLCNMHYLRRRAG